MLLSVARFRLPERRENRKIRYIPNLSGKTNSKLASEPSHKSEEREKTLNCINIKKSTKNSPVCNHIFNKTAPLLITGTPRSGTVSSTVYLKPLQFGNDCQRPKKHGMVSWIHIVYSPESDYVGPTKSLNGLGFKYVLHQRRNVLKSLSSIIFTEPLGVDGGPTRKPIIGENTFQPANYLRFLSEHIPLNLTASRKYKGLQFWVEWQLFVKSIADGYFRVEDLMSSNISKSIPITKKIYDIVGEPPPDESALIEKIKNVNTNVNHRNRKHTLTWEEVFDIDEYYASIAYNISKEYGYE